MRDTALKNALNALKKTLKYHPELLGFLGTNNIYNIIGPGAWDDRGFSLTPLSSMLEPWELGDDK